MARRAPSPLDSLASAPAVRQAAAALLDAVTEEWAARTLDPEAYLKEIRRLERGRGRPLFFPLLLGGTGRGARVRLADGTHKLDFIGGIGVYAFGHSDRDLLETAVVAAATDSVFQGHLAPGPEYHRLTAALLRHSGKRLRHAWLSVSGAMANENALKMIQQKHQPADRIVVFENAFAGRTSAMAELTDRPAFREGLPLRGNVLHVPFYDPSDLQSAERSLAALDAHLARYPGRVAGMMFELVQGEGGFNTAPPEFFIPLMERCREAGIAVWVDEVQTFARTGELYAFQSLGLEEFVDLMTIGKVLQGSAVLFSKAYNPKPGLIAGTFAGATTGMAVGARIIERLEKEGYLGAEGRIAVLARRVERRFESLEKRMPRAVGPRSGVGAMQAFVPFDGSPEVVKAIIESAFEAGLIIFGAGRNPGKIRMLLPVNTTDEELEAAFTIIEKALAQVAEERGTLVLILRPVRGADLDDLLELAGQLDSVNLPQDDEFLARRVALSEGSFAGQVENPQDAVYFFALEDTERGVVVGCSLIIAKVGRPGVPYYWFEVSSEERRSAELGHRFVHTKLRLRWTEDGPTEIGGLILEPEYRRHPERCGKALSIVRLAYISAHPQRFESQLIAEMLSPFDAPGKNRLWDAFGARFTGLSYREADRLSARSKQFIADLFPLDPVYVSLFPDDVQKVIGQPNESAKAAVRILEKVGFHPLNQVDPFDGGPYFGAARDAVVSVRERRELVLPGLPMEQKTEADGPLALLSAEGRLGFRATVVPLDAEGAPVVSAESREALGLDAGERVSVTPLP